ncbi:MAG: hypothetical protein WCT23_04980 [Candidatus Neomarinimicrobiota bacterium]
MKKVLILFFLFSFFISTPLRAEAEDVKVMLRGFSRLYPAMEHVHTNLHPGIALTSRGEVFPLLATNISLADTYFLEACLGAAKVNNIDGGLAQYSIGLGHYDSIKKMENLYYSFALSLRNFNSTYINSSALVFEALLEQKVDQLYVGIGLDLISQDYKIRSGGEYSEDKDRIYHPALIVHLRTRFLNLRAAGVPGGVNLNLSANLNMEKK